LIHKLLAAQPEKSDRQIAEMAKASPTTVGKVRAKMEPTVQPGQLKRTGKDGKARKQPGRRISAAAREQEARDRETCIALDAKVKDAERELAEARKQPEGLARARDAIEARARSLAAELMHVDRELAQQISEHLSRHGAVAYSAFFAGLHCELNRLEAERAGNGTDPEQASRGAAGRGSSALDAPADHAGDMPVGAAGTDVDPEQAAEQRKQAFAAMETEEPAKTEAPPVEKAEKRGRGRPKGSKNKPKVAADTEIPEPVIGNDPGPIPESLRRDRVRP
jgi:hypothetical protein